MQEALSVQECARTEMRKIVEVEEQLVLLQQSRRENGGEPKQPAAAAPTAEMKEKPKHGSTNHPTNS